MPKTSTLVLVAAFACLPSAGALAQTPATAPAAAPPAPVVAIAAPACEKPEFPGKVAPDPRIRKWSADFRAYLECLKAYVGERNATIEANSKAAKKAVEEFNSDVAEFNEQVKSLSD
ncbi:MAG: hypothetical protein ABI585_00410 [Betaproteobacteria bacterium]